MSTSPTIDSRATHEDVSVPVQTDTAADGEQIADSETPVDGTKPKKAKSSASEPLKREPGKSLFPYSRIQRILKADKVSDQPPWRRAT